jgi:hypothetical protein
MANATDGPSFSAQTSMRAGVHSAWRRCEDGMWSGTVTWLRCAESAPPVRPGIAGVAGHALAAVENLDRGAADTDIELLPDQAERHRIPAPVRFDMIIRRDTGNRSVTTNRCSFIQTSILEA